MGQYILGLSPSNLIKVIRKKKIHQKNGEREREREREMERERELNFFVRKIWIR